MNSFRLFPTVLPIALSFGAAAGAMSLEDTRSPGNGPSGAEGFELTTASISDLFGDLDGGGPFYDTAGNLLGKRGFYRMPDDGSGTDLGDLPGGMSETTAHASNTAGLIVGRSAVAGGTHAFLWREGEGMTDLGDLPGGDTAGVAHGINAAGTVVGTGATDDGPRAFLWKSEAGMWDLNDLIEEDSGIVLLEALAINDAGQVAGRAEDDTGERAFVWDPATGLIDLSDPVTAPTLESDTRNAPSLRFVEASAFGDDGLAVGRALSEDGRERPVLWANADGLRDLGDLPGGTGSGVAHGINAATQIVGHSSVANGERAFLWEPDNGIVDLNSMILAYGDVVLQRAVDIDDRGRILAYGRKGTAIHYFLMTPETDDLGPGESAAETKEIAPGDDVPDSVVGFVKGSGAGGYALTDLGEFLRTLDSPPSLAMDDSGRIVGGCDLLTTACPYLSDNLELVTNFLDDDITNFFDDTRTAPGLVTAPGPTSSPVVGPVGGPGTRPDDGTPPGLPPMGGGFTGGGGGGNDEDEIGAGPTGPRPDDSTVSPVPLPPAAVGLLLALGLLGGMRRRKTF